MLNKGDKTLLVKDLAAEKNCSESTIWRAFRAGKIKIENNKLVDVLVVDNDKAIRYNDLDYITIPNLAILNELLPHRVIANTTSRGYTELEYVNRSKSKRLYFSFKNELAGIYWDWADTLIYGVFASLYKQAKASGKLSCGRLTVKVADILRQLHLQNTDDNHRWLNRFLNKVMDINDNDFRMVFCKLNNGDKRDEVVATKLLNVAKNGDDITYTEPPLGQAADFLGYVVSIPRNFIKAGRSTAKTVILRSYLLYRVLLSQNAKNYMQNAITKRAIADNTGKDITDDFLRNYFRFLKSKNVISGYVVGVKKIDFGFDFDKKQDKKQEENTELSDKSENKPVIEIGDDIYDVADFSKNETKAQKIQMNLGKDFLKNLESIIDDNSIGTMIGRVKAIRTKKQAV